MVPDAAGGGKRPGTLPFARERPGEAVLGRQTYDGFQYPALERHRRANGRRFVLTAGLVTSVCVLLAAASAAQRGYLAAVVEDGCADAPEAHEHALRRYGGWLFDRVTVDGPEARHAAWRGAPERQDALERAPSPAQAPPSLRPEGRPVGA